MVEFVGELMCWALLLSQAACFQRRGCPFLFVSNVSDHFTVDWVVVGLGGHSDRAARGKVAVGCDEISFLESFVDKRVSLAS